MDITSVFEHYEADENGCWNWALGKSKGYGAINYMGRIWMAHRVAYELKKGPIPEGLSVCHKCDNPACINPDHLFVGSHRDNMLDKERKGRANHVGAVGSRNGNSKLTTAQVISLLKDYVAGVPRKDIAKRYRLRESSVSSYTDGRAWAHLHGKNGCPTLAEIQSAKRITPVTEPVVREIWRLHFAGRNAREIAGGVKQSIHSVEGIIHGKTWRHLPDAPSIDELRQGGVQRGFNQFSCGGDSRSIHPRTKIPSSEIPNILLRIEAGETLEAIGATYGVKKAAIWRIKNAR